MSDVERLLQGAFDIHLHAAPDTMPMRLDVLDAARQAKEAGIRAIVLKNHHFPTTPVAMIANKVVPDIHIFGSVCLEYEVGGFNSQALKACAELGAKAAWMPGLSYG